MQLIDKDEILRAIQSEDIWLVNFINSLPVTQSKLLEQNMGGVPASKPDKLAEMIEHQYASSLPYAAHMIFREIHRRIVELEKLKGVSDESI